MLIIGIILFATSGYSQTIYTTQPNYISMTHIEQLRKQGLITQDEYNAKLQQINDANKIENTYFQQADKFKFCTQCGTKVSIQDTFCQKCGKRLEK